MAHILAQAVQRTFDATAKLGIGPAIDNGFYYDFIFSQEIVEEKLKDISKYMQKICKENQLFLRVEVDYDKAKEIVNMMGEAFKIELLDGFKADGETVFSFYINTIAAAATDKLLADVQEAYKTKYNNLTSYLSNDCGYAEMLNGQFVTFIDMCEGPHVENTKEVIVDAFVLEKIAGAYWRGDANNPMMTRIYGLSFESKEELKAYQTMMEEARKRDHRILGAKLKIFTISELVGSGLPLFQPNGAIIRKELEDYLWTLHKDRGYSRVWTPHLAKEDLYKISGHAGHYLDDMFKVHGGTSNEDFYVKPMNCPHHMQIFADNQFSYRDMPIRYFEPATVYRDEKTGQLAGLARVRSITQDDGHLFCRVSQIHEEVSTIVKIIKEFYTTMNMLDGYRVRLSLRGDDKEHYLGGDEIWEAAENALTQVCDSENLPYKAVKGEAAFYGPKLDFMFKDAIGREWQLATCQLDFNLPQRFDLSFVNEQGEK
ncbi:TPA: threonine--tRNA ligase, partial [Patescibacteria group bacterium]|nr:threonine--tRNA ligase [Candidatus Gracilibacteria bacterium]